MSSRIALSWSAALLLACGGGQAQRTAPEPAGGAAPDHEHAGEPAAEHRHGHGPIGHRFEHAEEWAKRFDDPERDQWQRPAQVVAAMAIEPGMTVADIGAGTGYFLPHLSRAVGENGHVLGLDIEPDMVRYMNERAAREGLANVEARVVGTDDPGLADGSVDRILIVDTWHHIAAREEYARRLRRALADGGAVYIVDFTQETKRGPPKAHRLPPDAVVEELRAAGLTVSVDEKLLPDQYVISAR